MICLGLLFCAVSVRARRPQPAKVFGMFGQQTRRAQKESARSNSLFVFCFVVVLCSIGCVFLFSRLLIVGEAADYRLCRQRNRRFCVVFCCKVDLDLWFAVCCLFVCLVGKTELGISDEFKAQNLPDSAFVMPSSAQLRLLHTVCPLALFSFRRWFESIRIVVFCFVLDVSQPVALGQEIRCVCQPPRLGL